MPCEGQRPARPGGHCGAVRAHRRNISVTGTRQVSTASDAAPGPGDDADNAPGADEADAMRDFLRDFQKRFGGLPPQLKLPVRGEGSGFIVRADALPLRVGEWVLAIGSPFGFESTVAVGVISAARRSLPGNGWVSFIQTDAAINPGNAGGPLINMRGEVIGINSQIYSQTGGYQGLSFAIPIEVSKGSAAERAGLVSGDVVLAANGRPVELSGDLPATVGLALPGDAIELEVWHLGTRVMRRTRLDRANQRTAEATAAAVVPSPKTPGGQLGLSLRALQPGELRSSGAATGLLVEAVSRTSARAGLQVGGLLLAINGRAVTSSGQAASLIAQADRAAALLVQRCATELYVALRLE